MPTVFLAIPSLAAIICPAFCTFTLTVCDMYCAPMYVLLPHVMYCTAQAVVEYIVMEEKIVEVKDEGE